MEIGTWILSFCIMAIETWGSIYFFDIFMERKRRGRLDKYKHIILYPVVVAVASLGEYLDSMGSKVLLIVLTYMAFTAVSYQTNWKQCIFFSILNYSLLFLADLFSLQVENILIVKSEEYASNIIFLALPAKLVWVLLLFMLRRIWKGKNSYGALSHKEWQKFGIVPLFTLASMLLMYFCYSGEKKVQAVYLFLSAGLIMINFLVMVLMQDILVKGELLRESALTDQKKESQLAHYRDMQTVYERQGRKMHDYLSLIHI